MEAEAKPKTKARILVVDDEPDITTVIKQGLESTEGYLVDAFNDSEQALSHFKSDYYDMLIFDIKMPRLTGFQLYREIRKKDSKAKVCFMTAFDVYMEEFRKVFPTYDIKSFVKKPVKVKDLKTIIDAQLENK